MVYITKNKNNSKHRIYYKPAFVESTLQIWADLIHIIILWGRDINKNDDNIIVNKSSTSHRSGIVLSFPCINSYNNPVK